MTTPDSHQFLASQREIAEAIENEVFGQALTLKEIIALCSDTFEVGNPLDEKRAKLCLDELVDSHVLIRDRNRYRLPSPEDVAAELDDLLESVR